MTKIAIELLKAPTIVHHPDFDFGEVQDVAFLGETYSVTVRTLDPELGFVTDDEFEFVVDAGGSVDFGGRGEPKLRNKADVSLEEWQAKIAAKPVTLDAATDAFCAMLVGRNERRERFFGAVRIAAE